MGSPILRLITGNEGRFPHPVSLCRFRKVRIIDPGRKFADYGRRPKLRPNINDNKDPDGLFLPGNDRLDFIGLKLRNRDPSHFSIIESAPSGSCFF